MQGTLKPTKYGRCEVCSCALSVGGGCGNCERERRYNTCGCGDTIIEIECECCMNEVRVCAGCAKGSDGCFCDMP